MSKYGTVKVNCLKISTTKCQMIAEAVELVRTLISLYFMWM